MRRTFGIFAIFAIYFMDLTVVYPTAMISLKNTQSQLSHASRQKDPINLVSAIYDLLFRGVKDTEILYHTMYYPLIKLYKDDTKMNNVSTNVNFNMFTFDNNIPSAKCKFDFFSKSLSSATIKVTCPYKSDSSIIHLKLIKVDNAWKIQDVFYSKIQETLSEVLQKH